MSALHYAARRGDIDEIRRWLASGAPVDLLDDKYGHTALLEACISTTADPEVLLVLLDAGAEVNMQITCARECGYEPLLHAAVPWLTTEKARLLIEAGVHQEVLSSSAVVAAENGRFDILDLLFTVGADPFQSQSAASVIVTALSKCGEFHRLAQMLAKGASPVPLAWSALFSAIVFGSVDEAAALIRAGADLEQTDAYERTPFLLAIHAGRRDMAALLFEKGANAQARGPHGLAGKPHGRPAHSYAISRDDPETLRWLLDLDHGFGIDERKACCQALLLEAAEWDAVQCCRVLLESGADAAAADKDGWKAARGAVHPEIVKMFIERGADPQDLQRRSLCAYMGVAVTDALEATREEYGVDRFHRFGTANPERMEISYWKAMVRCAWKPDQGSSWWFGEPSGKEEGRRLWCCNRWGMSFTPLPDGRFMEIGGVFEDHYLDPDFCIYNDVIIHDGQGGIEILGYEQAIFPPTDYHSATLAGGWIYIIGNVGYPNQRRLETPVYRLHLETGAIEKVATSGESPGWISDHDAVLSGDRIRISGGVVYSVEEAGSEHVHDNTRVYWLDLATGVWEREGEAE